MIATGAITGETLNTEQLRKIDAYWRAANYLSVGQIYLLDNSFSLWFSRPRGRLNYRLIKPYARRQ